MGRSIEHLAGLLGAGAASVGPIGFAAPEILWPDPSGTSAPSVPRPLLVSDSSSSAPGRRSVTVRSSTGALSLDFAVPTPEISGGPGSVAPAGPKSYVVHGPLAAEEWIRLAEARPELVVIGNARYLFHEGEPFVTLIRDLRTALGVGPIVWAPRVALPHRLALLSYLGIDLLDGTETRRRAIEGEFLDPVAGIADAASFATHGVCRCEGCRDEPVVDLVRHGDLALAGELARVRASISSGTLRELVEARLSAEPILAELLRYADRVLGDLLEERTPVVGHGVRPYVLTESQRRPEIRRFRRRLLERYVPPPSKRVLLIVPCSRTKPYRNSPSHRKFARAWEGLLHAERIHVVSVTSPLGLVPRELEDVYPAKHYDIPVTGDWSEDERRAVTDAFTHLVSTGRYDRIVLHLDPSEYGFLRSSLPSSPRSVWTIEAEAPTSPRAIAALHEALSEALADVPDVKGGALSIVREELQSLAGVQFGVEPAARLFAAPVRLAGRPWFQRLTEPKGADLATWREERGLFHLTVAGGERLLAAGAMQVEVDPTVSLAGDLFAPGVRAADPNIRSGDAVLLTREGRLIGVGEASLPGPVMSGLRRGIAVRVRHRRHRPEDTPPTDTANTEDSSPESGPVV